MVVERVARRPEAGLRRSAKSTGSSVAVVADSGRVADPLRVALERCPEVASVVLLADTRDLVAHELVVVRIGSTGSADGLASVAAATRSGIPCIVLGPLALSSRALRLGAISYLGPADVEGELAAAVTSALIGRRHLGASVVEGYLSDGLAVAEAVSRLSARELEIVCRAGRGEPPARTAAAIGVAAEAVTQYRLRARSKLGLGTTAEIRSFALTHGLR